MRTAGLFLLLGIASLTPACATTHGGVGGPVLAPPALEQEGYASFYGTQHHGRRTASGEVFDAGRLTAAHRTLPFGTKVRVTNLNNGRHVVVRVNDRGPFRRGRVIDVSRRAAKELGFLRAGTTRVRIEVLEG